MLFSKDEHSANAPETWVAVKLGRTWQLRTQDGGVLEYRIPTKRQAEALKHSGHLVHLYEQERRWYAGEQVAGWRPYAATAAEQRCALIRQEA